MCKFFRFSDSLKISSIDFRAKQSPRSYVLAGVQFCYISTPDKKE